LREWFEVVVFALTFALITNTFVFATFHVPTPSMENTIMVGDFLVVTKVQHGPRTPMSIGIPFTDIHIDKELPWFRIPGFSPVERGEPFVFNYPPEDGVISRRTHYVKRAMAVPGDVIELRDKKAFVNGLATEFLDGMEQEWLVYKTDSQVVLPARKLREMGVDPSLVRRASADGKIVRILSLSQSKAREIEKWAYVEKVEPYAESQQEQSRSASRIYPLGSGWGRDNYGPLKLPQEGDVVVLSDDNWTSYEEIIQRHEGKDVKRVGVNQFEQDGKAISEYTFEQGYYFAIGDNRDNSLDSRYWGLVPENHIEGKPFMIYFSWDSAAKRPRIGRMLNLIR